MSSSDSTSDGPALTEERSSASAALAWPLCESAYCSGLGVRVRIRVRVRVRVRLTLTNPNPNPNPNLQRAGAVGILGGGVGAGLR